MKILMVTNMRPSPQKKYSGIFVKNLYDILEKTPDISQVDLYSMSRTFTGIAGSVIKYLKGFVGFIPWLFKKYDVLHVHFIYPFIFLGIIYKALHPRSALVATIHGSDVHKHINSTTNRFVYSNAVKQVDYLIAVGSDIAIEAEQKLSRKADTILSAGVNSEIFFKIPGLEKKYDFVFAGSFIERKGIDLVINSIKEINNPEIKFCFIGSGIFITKLQELKKEFNVEIFESLTQPEMNRVFNQSRFLILASRAEPFGLVVTEALYSGIPAIVSSAGGLKEQVSDNNNGFIINELSASAIKETLLKAHRMPDDEYSLMAEHAVRSNKQHSLQEISSRHVEIYQSLVRKKKQG